MKKLPPVPEATRTTFRPRLEALETRLTPTTFTVSSLADSGDGSLRAAITSVNSDTSADEIDFSVAGVIQLTSGALPVITNTVKIDGSTAPGFAGAPVVEIDNNGFAGLTLSGANSTLASLSIVNANGAGVTLAMIGSYPSGASITVVGNYIGLALDGSIAANTSAGLLVKSLGDIIGGTASADRNVISGNGGDGIQIYYQGTIQGNFIGTDPTGQSAAPNQGSGITTFGDGSLIGGTSAGAGNTIAFNTQSGVAIVPAVVNGLRNSILSNSIFSNGSKGIDLQQNGNGNMPAPQISYAVESPGSAPGSFQVQVGGVLNTSGSALLGDNGDPGIYVSCTIQLFATLNGVPAGQGQLYLGSVNVTTDANGYAPFNLRNVSVPESAGITFTATATHYPNLTGFLETSEFSNPIGPGTANQAFVANVYQQLLNRVPDPGSAIWVSALNNGVAPATVVLAIEGSREYLADQVFALYNLYLYRNPDAAGEQLWTNFLLAGGTLEQLGATLVSSSEAFINYGGSNPQFIAILYNNVLRRPFTGQLNTPENVFWQTMLDNGASRFDVAMAFFTSQEYLTNVIQNEPTAAFYAPGVHQPFYVTFLLRPADDAGLAAWVNALNVGATDQQVLAGIFGSAEGYQLWS